MRTPLTPAPDFAKSLEEGFTEEELDRPLQLGIGLHALQYLQDTITDLELKVLALQHERSRLRGLLKKNKIKDPKIENET